MSSSWEPTILQYTNGSLVFSAFALIRFERSINLSSPNGDAEILIIISAPVSLIGSAKSFE